MSILKDSTRRGAMAVDKLWYQFYSLPTRHGGDTIMSGQDFSGLPPGSAIIPYLELELSKIMEHVGKLILTEYWI